MTTQEIEPCKFIKGIWINCNEEVGGKCGGWVEPSGEVQMLKQLTALTAERDALLAAGKLINAYVEWTAYGNCRADAGPIPTAAEVSAALKQAGVV